MLQPSQRQAPGPLRTTYTVASGPYDTLNNFTAWSVGPGAAYTSAMSITGSFTTAAPFGPNHPVGTDITSQLVSFCLSDGVNTCASTDPNVRAYQFNVVTDASGDITIASVLIEKWQTGGSAHSAGDRVASMNLNGPTINQALTNFSCSKVGATTSSGQPDVCMLQRTTRAAAA